ncbi:MFS transporter [Ktedonobacter sp. SOSP1-52]|uniref:MFS transporter n=1 Tax=Ktedonobacter sp. SOSP1-52 TaxID=2778366 RepID=UPI001915AF52|nr:MFS transporter [Ktedonobacter sp. SOSP1-52]GHO69869.1 MFS transporter [Ktedonobacter sp. SOSP1-52]
MSSVATSLNRNQRNTFIASFLGWTLDAFDFFLVSLTATEIAKEFHLGVTAILLTVTLTLAMRPLGALIFGLLAERFGRRTPLMIDILLYSALELLTAFSPNYITFLVLRILFGIGMGGEWGLGSSLAMESLPTRSRGLYSGILQQGYAFGYLLAALAYGILFPIIGWRGLFIVGALPALLVVYIRLSVTESEVWAQRQESLRSRGIGMWQSIWKAIKSHGLVFLYVIFLMTAFNSLSHGTQDNLPTFLKAQLHFSPGQASTITIISNIGAIIGGTLFGAFSQSWGRRRAIIIASILGIIMIPLWTGLIQIPLVGTAVSLSIGAFLLQFMVQGAWGIIPAHLNELSPTDVRGTFPGFAYQLGNLFASWIVFIEGVTANALGTEKLPNYQLALAYFSLGAFLAVIIFTAVGREAREADFLRHDDETERVELVETGETSPA